MIQVKIHLFIVDFKYFIAILALCIKVILGFTILISLIELVCLGQLSFLGQISLIGVVKLNGSYVKLVQLQWDQDNSEASIRI